MEGSVDLGYPAMHQLSIKLTISRSPVWRPNHYTTEPTSHVLTATYIVHPGDFLRHFPHPAFSWYCYFCDPSFSGPANSVPQYHHVSHTTSDTTTTFHIPLVMLPPRFTAISCCTDVNDASLQSPTAEPTCVAMEPDWLLRPPMLA